MTQGYLAFLDVVQTSFFGRFVTRIVEHDCSGMAAEAAFRFLLSFVPSMIFLVALTSTAGLSERSIDFIVSSLIGLAPKGTEVLLDDTIRTALEHPAPGLLTTSLLITIWSASGTLATFTKALNRAHHVPYSHYSLGRSLVVPFFLLPVVVIPISVSAVLVVAGTELAERLATVGGFPFLGSAAGTLVRWTTTVLLVTLVVALIYRISPSGGIRFRDVAPGACLATALWVLVSLGFRAFTLSSFARYEIYGSLAAVVLFLFWVYLGAFVFMLGAEFNALVMESKRAADSVGAIAEPVDPATELPLTAASGREL